ncbi:unnamed protein product [Candida verbasci]|uniref:Acid phosphatase n=1 Tax=Candida verbasci TaxID=1227364 RepID=A0A9W4TW56_9ASCO|nr:unnamed protein product [Candida verbasci]
MVSISHLINSGLLLVGQNQYQDVASPQQAAVDNYNIARFLGGSGPYVQNPGYGISTEFPEGCKIQQVQLVSRHGERFPTANSARNQIKIWNKFKQHNGTFNGALNFLNDYEFYAPDENYYGLETTPENSQGLFSGTTDALRRGAQFRAKYKDLYNANQTLPVFTSNSNRVHQTAQYFAQGFLGQGYSNPNAVKINILAEGENTGANSMTPLDSCVAYDSDENKNASSAYNDDWLKNLGDRLTKENPDIKLEKSEVATLFDWCAYELNVKGQSPVCDLFTNEDLVNYAYYDDLDKYYSHSFGNSLAQTVGSVPVNASLTLLKDDSADNKIWLSFTHDTDIDLYGSALGLFEPKDPLPYNRIVFDRTYQHANLVPQMSQWVLEKLQCSNETFVRYIVNDAVIPIEGIATGPGFSSPLKDYEDYINKRLQGKNYIEQCNVPSNVSQSLTFYWDWKTKNYTAPLEV